MKSGFYYEIVRGLQSEPNLCPLLEEVCIRERSLFLSKLAFLLIFKRNHKDELLGHVEFFSVSSSLPSQICNISY